MSEKPNYYAVIPAEIRYNKKLTPNAKLLYAEITALCNMNGKCNASTKYFANLYEVSRVSIQNWLKLLEENNYINRTVIYKKGSKEILSRSITLINNPCKNIFTDNTNININNNNITYSNIDKLEQEVNNFDTIDKHKIDFLEYWLEANRSGKTKYEMQKTWNTKRRLTTWIKNYNKWWQKDNISKVDKQLDEYLKGKELL